MGGYGEHIPTSGTHKNCNRNSATMAMTTHTTGCTYMASQKKRESVAFTTLVPGSLLSNTHRDSPAGSTSFHQRSPTRRRPAMFFV